MEADTEPHEERDQCDDDAGRAIALLTRGDLVGEEERGDHTEARDASSGRHSGREHLPQRDLAIQEHVGGPPPEERGGHEREQKDQTAAPHRPSLVEELHLDGDVEGECHDPCGVIDEVPEEALRRRPFVDPVVPRRERGSHPDPAEHEHDRAEPSERGDCLVASSDETVDIAARFVTQSHPGDDRFSDVSTDDG